MEKDFVKKQTKKNLRLETNVQYVKGVGPKLGALLSSRGIHTVGDLFEYYPRAYEDRRAARDIRSLKAEEVVSLKAKIFRVSAIPMGRSQRKIYDVAVRDDSGQIHCKFFRVPYKGYFERFTTGKEVRVVGKVTLYRGRLEFHHPEIKDLESEEELADVLVPIYSEIEGLSSSKILKVIRHAWPQVEASDWPGEVLPVSITERYGLLPRKRALEQMHFPLVEEAQKYFEFKSRAQERIIFEEFFWLELLLAAKKAGVKKEKVAPMQTQRIPRLQKFLDSLPFSLTSAQQRAFGDVQKDLSKDSPMHRMIQGDVGSGKTMVALLSALLVADNKRQSCLMAPTEILAEQHYKNADKFLSPLGVRLALLTGKTKTAERKEILAELEAGRIDLLVGTHALIEDWVQFKDLALVTVDEQHRFGVEQRAKLKNKGQSPHFLVMTATPIPRTLAMTVYGDLDVSIINEMPPGRSPIQTRVTTEKRRKEALDFMSEQIKKGRQAYIVYPLVEESEKIDLKNAVEEFEKLKIQYPQIRFGLLHGKMKSEEKEQVMASFRKNETQVLVSTTVIEVGVDVPNANIMLIEHSERFGLSQLHQLRGRVGRGAHKSFCILLMGYAVSEEGRERTQFLETTTDGFKVAEFDLEMRGPGEFLGTKQSGLPGFKIANLVRDIEVLQRARQAAFDLLDEDPDLEKKENSKLREKLLQTQGPVG